MKPIAALLTFLLAAALYAQDVTRIVVEREDGTSQVFHPAPAPTTPEPDPAPASEATTEPAPAPVKPDATNTGVPVGTVLQARGSIDMTPAWLAVNAAGSGTQADPWVVEDKDVTGRVDVRTTTEYVVFRDSRVRGQSSRYYGVKVHNSVAADRVLLDSLEISDFIDVGIECRGATIRRCHIHDIGGDGINPKQNVRVEASFIERLEDGSKASAHGDCIQLTGSGNQHHVEIVGNTLDARWPPEPGYGVRTSVVFLKSDLGTIADVTVNGNWLNGGQYTIYVQDGGKGVPSGVTITNNRFGRQVQYAPLRLSGSVTRGGNVWDDTGEPLAGE